ncbi:MAG: hypothetical protein FJ209_12085 [Betaproteobacteria bacterium]|nr:hypothetical protein [Betaproteobacteria bacterium]
MNPAFDALPALLWNAWDSQSVTRLSVAITDFILLFYRAGMARESAARLPEPLR